MSEDKKSKTITNNFFGSVGAVQGDNSTAYVQQNHGIAAEQLLGLLQNLKTNIDEVSEDERGEVIRIVEEINADVQSGANRETIVKKVLKLSPYALGTVSFLANLAQIASSLGFHLPSF